MSDDNSSSIMTQCASIRVHVGAQMQTSSHRVLDKLILFVNRFGNVQDPERVLVGKNNVLKISDAFKLDHLAQVIVLQHQLTIN